jgi:hypothetical protein
MYSVITCAGSHQQRRIQSLALRGLCGGDVVVWRVGAEKFPILLLSQQTQKEVGRCKKYGEFRLAMKYNGY